LCAELERELSARYGFDAEPGAKPTAADVALFVVARDPAGNALGCGGLRLMEPGAAEIKRMFVRPGARGQGVASAVLDWLEREARARGIRLLRLETGTLQPEARRLYESAGYEPIPRFGPYAGAALSRCYQRRL
jgi:putative acetyltransferase